jgi:hypothetical protein
VDEEFVEVHLQGVRFERLRDFGDVWLALGLWRLLGLDTLLAEKMPDGRQEVPWPALAAILTIARFCEPSSELHIEDHWYARTALEDLLGVPAPKVYTDRLYAGLDRLLEHKDSLEKHLQGRLGDLFDLKYELLLYDVTSTYFEGLCAANPMAQRGYSRDSRPDCLQVCIGLVVTEDGMPLGHEVFDGNTHDSQTLETIVKAMEAKYGRAHRIWVVDRGMVSAANLKFLRGQGASYIVGTPKALLRQFEQHLTDQDWQQVPRSGRARGLCPGPQPRSSAEGTGDASAVPGADGGGVAEDAAVGRHGAPERLGSGPAALGSSPAALLAGRQGFRRKDDLDEPSGRKGETQDHL